MIPFSKTPDQQRFEEAMAGQSITHRNQMNWMQGAFDVPTGTVNQFTGHTYDEDAFWGALEAGDLSAAGKQAHAAVYDPTPSWLDKAAPFVASAILAAPFAAAAAGFGATAASTTAAGLTGVTPTAAAGGAAVGGISGSTFLAAAETAIGFIDNEPSSSQVNAISGKRRSYLDALETSLTDSGVAQRGVQADGTPTAVEPIPIADTFNSDPAPTTTASSASAPRQDTPFASDVGVVGETDYYDEVKQYTTREVDFATMAGRQLGELSAGEVAEGGLLASRLTTDEEWAAFADLFNTLKAQQPQPPTARRPRPPSPSPAPVREDPAVQEQATEEMAEIALQTTRQSTILSDEDTDLETLAGGFTYQRGQRRGLVA